MIFETLWNQESIDDNYIVAKYLMTSSNPKDYYKWAESTASDQSVGTWTHVEGESEEVVYRYGAKVVGIVEYESSGIIEIAYPIVNISNSISMLLSTVAGNLLGQEGIKLIDLHFPKEYLASFNGPNLGVDGIRNLLGVYDRPLAGSILKPCIGVPPEESSQGVVNAALGGIDIVKDDELLGHPDYSPMEERVRVIMNDLKELGKEKNCLYAVNITGRNLMERAKRAVDAGANALMVNYFALGYGYVEDLVIELREQNIKIPIFGHCAGTGAVYRSHTQGISVDLIKGKLARLIGIDMPLVYPDTGRFGIETNQLIQTRVACTSDLGDIKKSFITIAGGVHPGSVKELYEKMGNDSILMAGGGVYGHPNGGQAGAKALREAITAVASHQDLNEVADSSTELRAALDFWQ